MDENYRRGLLCQAKIKRRPSCSRGSYWGGFKENQRKRLIDRMGYLALLLYEYQDAQRTNLLPFRWQVCRGKSMDDVEGWLRGDSFPDLSTSEKIIQLLGDDKIGTGDKGIIDKLIAPLGVRDTLIVRIGWPSDQGPTRYALLQQMFQERNQTHIKHAEH
jgi:hypothetical protein